MANTQNPQGFEAIRNGAGGCNGRLGEYNLKSDYGTALFTGDLVKLVSGYINNAVGDATGVLGIFKGCQYTATDGTPVFSPYWPGDGNVDATKPILALINDDPNAEMVVETATFAVTNVGAALDSVTGTGSTVYGRSRQTAVIGAGALIALGLSKSPTNEYGAYAKVIVAFATGAHVKA